MTRPSSTTIHGVMMPARYGSRIFEHCRDIRFTVFVDEQQVPAENEMDDVDPVALHYVALVPKESAVVNIDGRVPRDQVTFQWQWIPTPNDHAYDKQDWYPVSTLRLFDAKVLKDKDGHDDHHHRDGAVQVLKLGRMAVQKPYRGLSIGSCLMRHAEPHATNALANASASPQVQIALHAQIDKRGFYERNGYVPEFREDGTLEVFVEENIKHIHMSKTVRLNEQTNFDHQKNK
jgi:predicted GNAT family N-acyltransferase